MSELNLKKMKIEEKIKLREETLLIGAKFRFLLLFHYYMNNEHEN